jgi:hypothetical protein
MFHREADGNRPTLSGGFNWEGTEFEISGWERTSKNNKPYISLSIKKRPNEREGKGRWEP